MSASRILLLQRLLRGRAAQNVMHEGKETRKALIKELRAADEQLEDPDEAAADILETRATEVKLAGTDHTAGATVSKLLLGLGTGYGYCAMHSATPPPPTNHSPPTPPPPKSAQPPIMTISIFFTDGIASHHLSAADEVKDQELPLQP